MYKHILIVIAIVGCGGSIFAQLQSKADSSRQNILLDEVVVSATTFAEKKKNIAQQIDVISAKSIAQTNAQNTGDLLLSTGKIAVQKSQQGGSSPVLRGFEASRILLIVDGVRMNNAIFRAGHLQNIITADQNMLSRVEVMYGPSSTIYGGDALGGAIHLVSKQPILSTTGKLHTTGSGFYRHSTVNTEHTVHADVSMGTKKWAWLQSYNYSDFGDLQMGKNFTNRYPNFGRRDSFILAGSPDRIVANPNPLVQKFSGYRQWDITQKLLYKASEKITHLLNFQYSNSSNVPRYDRLQDVRNGRLRFAEWYYGPQKRLLAAYQFSATQVAGFDAVNVNVNYQDVAESRQTREFNRLDRFDSRREQVNIWGATVSAQKKMGMHELTVGADMQLNDVKSTADRTNLTTGAVSKLDTRYPNGKNTMNNFGLFAQHIYKFGNGKWVLNDGIRLQHVHLHSTIADNSIVNLPVTRITQNNTALTGNLGVVYQASATTTLKSTLTSGFRAPNIDDLAKIFESSTALKQVVVPNASLKPEYTYGIDVHLHQQLTKKASLEFTIYHTWFNNAIALRPTRFNGVDSIEYNGILSQVVAMQNAASARLWGFSGSFTAQLGAYFVLTSSISYTWGRLNTNPKQPSQFYERQPNGRYALVSRQVKTVPLDHIPPLLGRTAINFKKGKWSSELACQYQGWKWLHQMNATGEDNAQYATAEGFPAWMLLNFRANFQLNKVLQLQTGVENLLDRNYRMFASGFSGGGRNLFLCLRAQW
jgi:hemoglobin/transferrin/lactoferrin receptor protein